MKESMITVRLQYYINFARALVSGSWGNAFFFSSTLFPAHTFLIVILGKARQGKARQGKASLFV